MKGDKKKGKGKKVGKRKKIKEKQTRQKNNTRQTSFEHLDTETRSNTMTVDKLTHVITSTVGKVDL